MGRAGHEFLNLRRDGRTIGGGKRAEVPCDEAMVEGEQLQPREARYLQTARSRAP
jgi:hypothetical protein